MGQWSCPTPRRMDLQLAGAYSDYSVACLLDATGARSAAGRENVAEGTRSFEAGGTNGNEVSRAAKSRNDVSRAAESESGSTAEDAGKLPTVPVAAPCDAHTLWTAGVAGTVACSSAKAEGTRTHQV